MSYTHTITSQEEQRKLENYARFIEVDYQIREVNGETWFQIDWADDYEKEVKMIDFYIEYGHPII